MARTTAPTPPRADDSVGVAMPVKIEPRTTTISASGGMIANSALKTSFLRDTPGSSGMAGAVSGFSLVSTRM